MEVNCTEPSLTVGFPGQSRLCTCPILGECNIKGGGGGVKEKFGKEQYERWREELEECKASHPSA
jgi:hypothetical protein